MGAASTDYEFTNSLIGYFKYLAQIFGDLADKLYGVNSSFVADATVTAGFTAAGATLTTLFLVMEISTFAFNINFKDGLESGIRLAMKTVLYLILIENVPNATAIITEIFQNIGGTSFSDSFTEVVKPYTTIAAVNADTLKAGTLNINLIFLDIMIVVALLISLVLFILILISMAGLVFETAILTVISPVAVCTLINTQARSTGIAFLKNFAAVNMQWGLYSVCFNVFGELYSEFDLTNEFAELVGTSSGGASVALQCMTPLFAMALLCVSISKVGDFAKRALGG